MEALFWVLLETQSCVLWHLVACKVWEELLGELSTIVYWVWFQWGIPVLGKNFEGH